VKVPPDVSAWSSMFCMIGRSSPHPVGSALRAEALTTAYWSGSHAITHAPHDWQDVALSATPIEHAPLVLSKQAAREERPACSVDVRRQVAGGWLAREHERPIWKPGATAVG
jgi:hypothetical protein